MGVKMKLNEDLKKLEQKAYRSYFDDGIWDIAWGVWLAGWAVTPFFDFLGISRFFAYSIMFIPALLLILGKKYITVPRIGMVHFSQARRRKKLYIFIAGVAVLIVTLLLYLLASSGNLKESLGAYGRILLPLAEAFTIFLIIGTLAFFIDFSRLYIYAAMFAAGIIVTELLYPVIGEPWDALLGFGLFAAAILCYGLIRLVSFLCKYPHRKVEYGNDIGQ